MTTKTQSELIKAINGNPEDKEALLAYAEWLNQMFTPKRAEAYTFIAERDKVPKGWIKPMPSSLVGWHWFAGCRVEAYNIGDIIKTTPPPKSVLRTHETPFDAYEALAQYLIKAGIVGNDVEVQTPKNTQKGNTMPQHTTKGPDPLPCPFCGNENRTEFQTSVLFPKPRLQCCKCKAIGPAAETNNRNSDAQIHAWNKRPQNTIHTLQVTTQKQTIFGEEEEKEELRRNLAKGVDCYEIDGQKVYCDLEFMEERLAMLEGQIITRDPEPLFRPKTYLFLSLLMFLGCCVAPIVVGYLCANKIGGIGEVWFCLTGLFTALCMFYFGVYFFLEQ